MDRRRVQEGYRGGLKGVQDAFEEKLKTRLRLLLCVRRTDTKDAGVWHSGGPGMTIETARHDEGAKRCTTEVWTHGYPGQ